MAVVVWTPRAYADLEAIGDYLARDSPGVAERLLRQLYAATDRFEAFPASGRIVPEIGDESLREVIYRNYRIVYLHIPGDDRVEVLSVFHASRQFGRPPDSDA
ncbi:MAG: type II toxin-antitoxin system RelE/ParE family toxin [Bacteroidota bacterium]